MFIINKPDIFHSTAKLQKKKNKFKKKEEEETNPKSIQYS